MGCSQQAPASWLAAEKLESTWPLMMVKNAENLWCWGICLEGSMTLKCVDKLWFQRDEMGWTNMPNQLQIQHLNGSMSYECYESIPCEVFMSYLCYLKKTKRCKTTMKTIRLYLWGPLIAGDGACSGASHIHFVQSGPSRIRRRRICGMQSRIGIRMHAHWLQAI